MADWTLKILVDSDTKKAERDFKGLRGVLDDLPGQLQALGRAGLAGMGMLGGAALAAAGGLAKLAVDAAPLQSIRAAFDNLAKSMGSSGDEMLAALQKASGGMITQIDLMKSFNLAAQLVGEDFAVRLPEAMQYLAKVSAATGEDVNFMLDSLVRGIGRLSPMILDNLGVQVSLEEATARAAAMFGVEADQLSKAQLQAGMMDVVLSKLRDNTATMPDIMGTAGASVGQLGVMFSDLKTLLGEAFLPVLTPILQSFLSLGEQYLPTIIEKAGQFGEKLGELVTALINTGINSEQTREALANLISPELTATITGVISVISDLAAKMYEFATTHSEEFKAAILAIAAVFAAAALAATIGAIAGAIASLANPITAIMLAVGLLAAAWAENWGGIQEKTQAVLEFIRGIVDSVLAAIKGFWQEHGDAIKSIVTDLWDVVRRIFELVFNIITSLVNTSLDLWKGFWQEHGGFIKDIVGNYWNAVKGLFETFFKTFELLTQALHSALKGDWRGFGEHLRNAVLTMWGGIRDTFVKFRDIIIGIFKYIIRRILSAVSNVDWSSVGSSIVEGIKSGVTNAAKALADAAAAVVRAALDAAKGVLGIRSPSREFQFVGQAMMDGLELGIIQGSGRVMRAVQGIAQQIGNVIDDPRLGGINVIDDPRLKVLGGSAIGTGIGASVTPGKGAGGTGIGTRGYSAGTSGNMYSSRAVELLTEIRDILAEEFGVDKSKFASADLAWSLRGARA